MAKDSGCDAVKFQKRTIDIVYSKEELEKPRQSPWGTTQKDQKQGLEFNEKQYDEIDQFCKKNNIIWFASAWDIASLDFLDKYNLPYNKIASAMITNVDFVKKIADKKKYTYISTGMSDYKNIDEAVKIFKLAKCEFELMHSVSAYPCPEDQLNLHLIKKLKEKYECKVGYSGHEPSVSPSIVAVCLGASSIERHITLDRSMYGSDQAASLEKKGLDDGELLKVAIQSVLKKVNIDPDITFNELFDEKNWS
jgi:N-acetylneuraminate synthase